MGESTPTGGRAWRPEHAVTADVAAALIGGAWPELRGVPVAPFATGWDNTAYLVDDRWVFRFPRRTIAAPLIEREVAVLGAIAPHLPVAVPVPRFVGGPTEAYPWSFAGYERLPGRTIEAADLDDAARRRLAGPLAEFLAVLHAIPPERLPPDAVGPDEIRRFDVAHRADRVRGWLDVAVAAGSIADASPWLGLVAAAEGLDPGVVHALVHPDPPSLVHGDLHARNLLVDDNGRLSGVIDWGDVHLGSPIVDRAVVPAVLPASEWAAFRSPHGDLERADAAWTLTRFRGLCTSLALLVSGHDLGAAAQVRDARAALDRLLGGP